MMFLKRSDSKDCIAISSCSSTISAPCYTGNNAYVFPGIGLGVLAAGSRRLTDEDMLAAAEALSDTVSEEQLKAGTMYPPLSKIREVSRNIAVKIANRAHDSGSAKNERPDDIAAYIESIMYDPWENPRPRSRL